jgi:signal peptidase II
MFIVALAFFVVFLDQITKQAVRSHLAFGESYPLIDGFFNLVYVRNDGAAWNILSGHGWVLILTSLFVLGLLLRFRDSLFETRRLFQQLLLGLLVGGILGNLIDRIRFGWVTDFLDFEFGTYHYPSFNVADSAICISVALYFIHYLFFQKKEDKETIEVAGE